MVVECNTRTELKPAFRMSDFDLAVGKISAELKRREVPLAVVQFSIEPRESWNVGLYLVARWSEGSL